MITLLTLYLASLPQTAVPTPLLVGHCYSSDSDFNTRIIKIVEVGKTDYKFMLYTGGDWFGVLSNFKETVEYNYTKEVTCEKK